MVKRIVGGVDQEGAVEHREYQRLRVESDDFYRLVETQWSIARKYS